MKPATQRPIRMALALGLVVVIASTFAVLHAGGSSAASTPTFTVTCDSENGANKAVLSWSGVRNLGYVYVYSSSSLGVSNDVRLPDAPKSGTLEVLVGVSGPSLFAHAQFFSAPDKSGNSVMLAEVDTVPECN